MIYRVFGSAGPNSDVSHSNEGRIYQNFTGVYRVSNN